MHITGYISGENERSNRNLDFVRFYLNNLLVITSGSFEEHVSRVGEVMKKPQLAGIKFKIDKCKFAVPKVE